MKRVEVCDSEGIEFTVVPPYAIWQDQQDGLWRVGKWRRILLWTGKPKLTDGSYIPMDVKHETKAAAESWLADFVSEGPAKTLYGADGKPVSGA